MGGVVRGNDEMMATASTAPYLLSNNHYHNLRVLYCSPRGRTHCYNLAKRKKSSDYFPFIKEMAERPTYLLTTSYALEHS